MEEVLLTWFLGKLALAQLSTAVSTEPACFAAHLSYKGALGPTPVDQEPQMSYAIISVDVMHGQNLKMHVVKKSTGSPMKSMTFANSDTSDIGWPSAPTKGVNVTAAEIFRLLPTSVAFSCWSIVKKFAESSGET